MRITLEHSFNGGIGLMKTTIMDMPLWYLVIHYISSSKAPLSLDNLKLYADGKEVPNLFDIENQP